MLNAHYVAPCGPTRRSMVHEGGPCAAYAPGESPPFQPPTALLLVIARLIRGADVVDLRPGLGMAACLASHARSVTALVQTNSSKCTELAAHVSAHAHTPHNVSVRCPHDFHVSGFPDADFYLWWQMIRFWDSGVIRRMLVSSSASRGGPIRRGARALVLYDMTQWRDAISWQDTRMNATWHKEVTFDDVAHCLATVEASRQALCATRGNGSWIAATFDLDAT